jgi:predicted component of type VI protein secretion system
MNYVLQVVRGRSATTTLKLGDGVTSLGRHDDCLIRIKSSQVSRRHCELFESGGKLIVRDLGSSNGTFVNGKRVVGQQPIKPGDELTVGAVTLRLASLGQAVNAADKAGPPTSKPGDTAIVEAIPVQDEEEFEIDFEDADAQTDLELIPLADPQAAEPVSRKPPPSKAPAPSAKGPEAPVPPPAQPPGKSKTEDEAVAEFLLDLNLDEAD